MRKASKKFTLVANWKMNPDTLEEGKALVSAFERKAKKSKKVTVIVCPPAAFLSELSKGKGKATHFGAQDVDARARGAFTGAISARQAKSAGAEYSIIGHSERRAVGDTDEIVAEKAKQALEANLRIVLCVGEKERDSQARYLGVVRDQILSVLGKVGKDKIKWVSFAYEPVWAIGKSYDSALSPRDIHEMSIYIKKTVAEAAGKDNGLKTQVLYGGSVNFENAQSILADGAIDGLLVGRQSLDAEAFSNMIDYASGI